MRKYLNRFFVVLLLLIVAAGPVSAKEAQDIMKLGAERTVTGYDLVTTDNRKVIQVKAVKKGFLLKARRTGLAKLVFRKGRKEKAVSFAVASYDDRALKLKKGKSKAMKLVVPNDCRYTISTSDKAVAAIDKTGRITGRKAGESIITVTITHGKRARWKKKVVVWERSGAGSASHLSCNTKALTLEEGTAGSMKIKGAKGCTVTYQSSNPIAAAVAPDGTISAILPGKTTITATVSSNGRTLKTFRKKVKVVPYVKKLVATYKKTWVYVGEEYPAAAISLKVTYSNGEEAKITSGFQKTFRKRNIPGETTVVVSYGGITLKPHIIEVRARSNPSEDGEGKDGKKETGGKTDGKTDGKTGKRKVKAISVELKKAAVRVGMDYADSDIILSVVYSDNTFGIVTDFKKEFTIPTEPGTAYLTVSYGGLSSHPMPITVY